MISLISDASMVTIGLAKSLVPTSYLGVAALVLSVAYCALGNTENSEQYHHLSALTVTPKIYVMRGEFTPRH